MSPAAGTMLTTLADMAEAVGEGVADPRKVLRIAVEAGVGAVERTREANPVNRAAGVVDAGARGLWILLEGALAAIEGRAPAAPAPLPAGAGRVATGAEGAHELPPDDSSWQGAYDVQYLVVSPTRSAEDLRAEMMEFGADCVIVIGDEAAVKVHVHTTRPDKIVAIGLTAGRIGDVVIEDLDAMAAEHRRRTAEQVPQARRPVGVVAVLPGDGFAEIARSLGATALRGGPTMNPSTEELLGAIVAANADHVIVLPNDRNVIAAAKNAAGLAECEVTVVPTRSVPQGMSALFKFEPTWPAADSARAMEREALAAHSLELTYAIRDSTVDGRSVREREAIALFDGALVAHGTDEADVLADACARFGEVGLLTLYVGSDVTPDRADRARQALQRACPGAEVEVREGGQPHYPFLVAADRRVSAPAAGPPRTSLELPVRSLPGVGEDSEKLLGKLGIRTIADLLWHLPSRHIDFSRFLPLRALQPDKEQSAEAVVGPIRERRTARGQQLTEVELLDLDGAPTGVTATWFGRQFIGSKIRTGQRVRISGKVGWFGRALQFRQPKIEAADAEAVHTGRLIPVYPLTEGLKEGNLRRWLHTAVEGGPRRTAVVRELEDPLPAAIRERRALLPISDALREVHFPSSDAVLQEGKRRLAFDELLTLQLGLAQRRLRWQRDARAPELRVDDATLEAWVAGLPFTLTAHQQAALADVRADLARRIPMSRLLEGDVGSGKTVVAALGARIAVGAGTQAALMAPTELLAEQHHRTVSALFADGGPSVALLTSSVPAPARREILERLASGALDVVVGTHALVSEGVAFHRLGRRPIRPTSACRPRAPRRPCGWRPSETCMRWNGRSTLRSCENGFFAPFAATAIRPCSRVNMSRIRLDSLQS